MTDHEGYSGRRLPGQPEPLKLKLVEPVAGEPPPTDCIRAVHYVTEFPPDEPVVSMIVHDDRIYLATCRRIFLIRHGEAQQLNIRLYETMVAYPDGS